VHEEILEIHVVPGHSDDLRDVLSANERVQLWAARRRACRWLLLVSIVPVANMLWLGRAEPMRALTIVAAGTGMLLFVFCLVKEERWRRFLDEKLRRTSARSTSVPPAHR